MGNYIGRFWHHLSDQKIQCDLCPHYCQLKEGQRGLCFVRQNINQELIQTTFGRSSGFCIDPVEKKPLNHFLPNTPILSFGTAGCNLSCKFCQNWDISNAKVYDRQIGYASPDEIARAAKQNHCKSVALTYNDPVIFFEYAIDVAIACHNLDIKVVAVSAAYMNPAPLKEFYLHMDGANIDLKAFSQDFYKKLTGADLKPVLENLIYIRHKTKTWLELTTLIIPGYNDSPEEIKAMSEWICHELGPDTPIHFSAFHPDHKMLDIPKTPLETLIRSRNIAMEAGLHYVYTGNVYYQPGDTTYCPQCQKPVIERSWDQLSQYHLTDDAKCRFCGTVIKGVFDTSPGTWGAKRKPISI